MPSVRLTVLPLASVWTKVRSRLALMLAAILSSASSQLSCFHCVAPAARYMGAATRRLLTASCIAVAPFGQRRPSLTGLAGSPSIWSSCVFPSAAVFVYAISEQPTAQ
jgi:hypothetical protein